MKVAGEGDAQTHAPNNNIFSPVSQPSVMILIWGGVFALSLLVMLKVKSRFIGSQRHIQPVGYRDSVSSDAEYVIEILRENDGYMKQSAIVRQTEWSKAKVSRLLSRMADHGYVRKNQDGRENIIVLED